MTKLAQATGAAIMALLGGAVFYTDASARLSGDTWLCHSHQDEDGGYDHNDGLTGFTVTSPADQHEPMWGPDFCSIAHEVPMS